MIRTLLLLLFGTLISQAADNDGFYNWHLAPFSRAGAYTAIEVLETNHLPVLVIRDVSGKYDGGNDVFRLEFLQDDKPAKLNVFAQPEKLSLFSTNADEGSVEICYEPNGTIRMRGKGIGIKITALARGTNVLGKVSSLPRNADQVRLTWIYKERFMLSALRGHLVQRQGDEKGNYYFAIEYTVKPDINDEWEAAIEEYQVDLVPHPYSRPFDRCVPDSQADFARWLAALPTVPDEYGPTRFLAAYITWSSLVQPRGLMTRTGMLMSKHYMNHLWSWDHCFNALALANGMPDLAWDQFFLPFDHQDKSGALPDYMDDISLSYGIVKPPIHGWALYKLRRAGVVNKERLPQAYAAISREVEFWMTCRDDNGNGIPEYHNGCDSGWDNATVYDVGYPAEGPDLCAFLVYQMDVLTQVATDLGKPDEAAHWKQRSDKLLERFIARLWIGNHFVTKHRDGNVINEKSSCLINLIPIILGNRLPLEIRTNLIADLKRAHGVLTPYGFASESPTSPLYERDGYWRGPVWAPTTLLIVDGLNQAGETALAKDVAKRFCDMCLKSGLWENYEATTGKGLRDPDYTWSASVYLILAHDYLMNDQTQNQQSGGK